MYTDPNLPRDEFGWKSPRLGLDMPIVRYGTWGRALLLFPTAQSDLLDNERFWLIKAIERHIFAGKITVFCINTVNAISWMDDDMHPAERVRRQALFASYVEEEVVPHVRLCLSDPAARIGVAGASFGAFHAANQFFRRPDLFDTLIAMSGFFDIAPYLDGYSNEQAYLNNPTWFLPNLRDENTLDLYSRSNITLVTGSGSWERPDKSRAFSRILADKGIAHTLDVWGTDVPHDWPSWHKMLDSYVEKVF